MTGLKYTLLFLLFALIAAKGNLDWVGFRFSLGGIKKSFGHIPSGSEWVSNLKKFKKHFDSGATPVVITIVSYYDDGGKMVFGFPKPSGAKSSKYIEYDDEDKYEKILKTFDNEGIKVWLQVEPGNNDLVELAKIVYKKYGKHKCVQGFGIDLEWWKPEGKGGKGSKISDKDAKKVVEYVRRQNSKHTVFIKHWETSYMPPKERDGLIFVNDSQGFDGLSDAQKQFQKWAKKFNSIPVMFQIGYDADSSIWKKDPVNFAKKILDSASKENNHIGIIWVDFTLKKALSKM